MSESIKNVVVVGASGNLGAPILQALLDSSVLNITVLSRATSEATFPPGVNVRKTDYTLSSLVSAFEGADAVVSAVGMGGFAHQKTMIDAAVKAGVKRFIPSEFSVNTMSPAVCVLVPVFAGKKDIIDYLVLTEREGLSWTGIAVGLLLDWVGPPRASKNIDRMLKAACRVSKPASLASISKSIALRSGTRGIRPSRSRMWTRSARPLQLSSKTQSRLRTSTSMLDLCPHPKAKFSLRYRSRQAEIGMSPGQRQTRKSNSART